MDEDGVAITWHNLSVTTRAGRQLLRNVQGGAFPGQMTALMGASGAGKTTLLNTLLSRNLKGLKVEGEILVNGHSIGKGVTEVSAYVQQEDLFVGTLTVEEHLNLQASMRLPRHWEKQKRQERVNKVVRDMLLENSLKSRIGIPGIVKGISGGELKRLAFATAILSDPPVLFCDEPTTGLDSHMAMLVVKQLEMLSGDQHKAVICTIHQPASEIFELFDKVLFLAGGRVAFFGAPSEAVTFFAHVGYRIPDHSNPADHYIQTLAVLPGQEMECKRKCDIICDEFFQHEFYKVMMDEIITFSQKRQLKTFAPAKWLRLARCLFIRYFKDNMRRKSVVRAKFLQKLVMGVFIGLLYLQTKTDQLGVLNLMGMLFYYCSELTYSTIFGIQTYMPDDFPLVAREYHDNIYPVSAYFVAKVLSYVCIFSVDGMVLVGVSYFMVGLTATNFSLTVLVCLLVELAAASAGIAICSVIELVGFSYGNLWGNLCILLIYTLCMYCFGYAALVTRVIRSR